VVDTEEPASFQEAQVHECWRRAMLDEMAAIEQCTDVRPIGLKWVFKTKRDAAGIITKHKAQLMAKGICPAAGSRF
jgi:hypothetical protein